MPHVPRLLSPAIWTAAWLILLFLVATQQFLPNESWLLDWHVYSAGAADFIERDLYYAELESVHRLPIDQFNYPPLSAIAVIPLLLLPDAVAGTAFVLLNVLAVAGTTYLAARILGARQPALWGGLGFLLYAIHPWVMLAFLGNNTPLVLFLVVAFAYQHLRGRNRSAGALLGAAIAFKLWPAALVPLLLRDRRWASLAGAASVLAAVAAVTISWLGFPVLGAAWHAMQATAPIEPGNPVFYVSWLRETQDWWPWWGGYAVALVLVAIPATGLLGIGLGIFAGLAVVPNLWRTYAMTLVVAGLFVAKSSRWPSRGADEKQSDRAPERAAAEITSTVRWRRM